MMKASLRSALVLGLAIGCSHSGDALFDTDGLPTDPPGGGSGNATAGGGAGAAPDPGVQGGTVSAAGTANGGTAMAGKPATSEGGAAPADPNAAGSGPDDGMAGKPDEPAQPECGNGKLEAGEECDDAGQAGQDGCEGCQVVCGHFAQGALESADHHCYAGYDEAAFDAAAADCTARGAHLVTISSADENQIVRMLVNTSKFIGGFEDVGLYQEGDGDYGWLTGEPMSYENWAAEQPDQRESRCGNGGPGAGNTNDRCYEHCMAMNGMGKWEDHRCDQPDGYVCEWEPVGH